MATIYNYELANFAGWSETEMVARQQGILRSTQGRCCVVQSLTCLLCPLSCPINCIFSKVLACLDCDNEGCSLVFRTTPESSNGYCDLALTLLNPCYLIGLDCRAYACDSNACSWDRSKCCLFESESFAFPPEQQEMLEISQELQLRKEYPDAKAREHHRRRQQKKQRAAEAERQRQVREAQAREAERREAERAREAERREAERVREAARQEEERVRDAERIDQLPERERAYVLAYEAYFGRGSARNGLTPYQRSEASILLFNNGRYVSPESYWNK